MQYFRACVKDLGILHYRGSACAKYIHISLSRKNMAYFGHISFEYEHILQIIMRSNTQYFKYNVGQNMGWEDWTPKECISQLGTPFLSLMACARKRHRNMPIFSSDALRKTATYVLVCYVAGNLTIRGSSINNTRSSPARKY